MKNLALTLFIMIISFGYSQGDIQSEKFRFKSFSLTPIGIYFDSNAGGLALNGDLSYGYKKHLFVFSGSVGSEFVLSILGSETTPDSYEQLNLSYGQVFKLHKVIDLDLMAGLGYFSFKSTQINIEKRGYERSSTIGFPLLAKIRFKTGSQFSAGLSFQANFNSVNNIYNTGLLFQWNSRN